MFLTHFQSEHIKGIQFFALIFRPNCSITFHSMESCERLERTLRGKVCLRYFPAQIPSLLAHCSYAKIDPGAFDLNRTAFGFLGCGSVTRLARMNTVSDWNPP